MAHAGTRTAAGLVGLVLLWIVIYWVWQPGTLSPAPEITFAEGEIGSHTPLGPTIAEAIEPPSAGRIGAARRAERDPVITVPLGPTVTPPAFRDYTVRDGDTFEIIARRELGDRALWTRIAQANPLRDPRRLRAGDVIRIPLDPDNIQGTPASDAPSPEPISDLDETPIVYLVKSGDSLSSIAEAYYGSQGFAEFIFRSNRDVLDSMDDLTIGMQLRLPPAPSDD
ncbi:MAG: LysM peptidoglycan-binding domain-containing protein [Phycisphaerales bacterium]